MTIRRLKALLEVIRAGNSRYEKGGRRSSVYTIEREIERIVKSAEAKR